MSSSKHKANKSSKRLGIPKVSKPEIRSNFKRIPILVEDMEKLRSRQDEKMQFSFRFLEIEHEYFNLGGTCSNWSTDLFKVLKEVSDIDRKTLVNEQRERYRAHKHDWNKLKFKYDLDGRFLEQLECRQIRISTSKGGIHGFLVGNRFYVVWLDPHHNLYPDDRYGGLRKFNPPETCCGKRDEELKVLNMANDWMSRGHSWRTGRTTSSEGQR